MRCFITSHGTYAKEPSVSPEMLNKKMENQSSHRNPLADEARNIKSAFKQIRPSYHSRITLTKQLST